MSDDRVDAVAPEDGVAAPLGSTVSDAGSFNTLNGNEALGIYGEIGDGTLSRIPWSDPPR